MARLADYFIVVGYDHEKTGRCGCAQGCPAVPGLFPPPLVPARPRPSPASGRAAGGGDCRAYKARVQP